MDDVFTLFILIAGCMALIGLISEWLSIVEDSYPDRRNQDQHDSDVENR